MRFKSRGVSLVELSVVVAMLGVIALVVLPDLQVSAPQRLALASQRVVDALRFARSEAIRSGRPVGVVIDRNDDISGVRDIAVFLPNASEPPFALEHFAINPLTRHAYDLPLESSAVGNGVDFAGEQLPFAYEGGSEHQRLVFFDEQGSPIWMDDTGRRRLDTGVIDLSMGTLTARITLEPATGQVHLQ